MNTAEKLSQVTQQLSEPMLAELLDFAEFLRQKKLSAERQTTNQPLLDLQGGLETSIAFADTPSLIQKKMRDEWN